MDGYAAVTITRVRKYPFSRNISVPRQQCPRHRLRRPFRRRRPFHRLHLLGNAQQQSKFIILCHLRRNILYYCIPVSVVCYPVNTFLDHFLCNIFTLLSFYPARYCYTSYTLLSACVTCTVYMQYWQICTNACIILYNIQSDPFNLLGTFFLENNGFYIHRLLHNSSF